MSRAQLTSTVEQNTGGAVAPFVAGKNKIINGDFYVNQRNFSSTTSGGYGFDRFTVANTGGTVTYSAQTFSVGNAPVSGYNARSYARVLTSGQSAAGDLSLFYQPIEDVGTLAGQTVTYSFWAKAASGTPKISLETEQTFGIGGSPSANVDTYQGQVTLSTSWARYSLTFTMPSISGKTLGNTSGSVYVLMWLSAGSSFNSRTNSLGIQNNTIDIWGVQIEAGSVATPFTTATGTLSGELAACQRYYYLAASGGVNLTVCPAHSYTATQMNATVTFPVTMRIAPTCISSSGTNYFSFNRAGGDDFINSVSLLYPSTVATNIYNNTEVSGTIGQAGTLYTYNASATIAFNAEL